MTRYNTRIGVINKYVSRANIERYGKVRRLQDGDTMLASALMSSTGERRDSTWVRVSIFHATVQFITNKISEASSTKRLSIKTLVGVIDPRIL